MRQELVLRGVRPPRKLELPIFLPDHCSANGLTVQAHAMLAKLFAIASRKIIATVMKK
jgi:hypothetical protein